LTGRIEELERLVQSHKDENRRNLEAAVSDLMAANARLQSDLDGKVADLQAKDLSILADLDVVRKHSNDLEQRESEDHEQMQQALQALNENMDELFKAVNVQILELQSVDATQHSEDERLQGVLDEHLRELNRLAEVKVEQALWQEHEDEMGRLIATYVDQLHARISDADADLNNKISESCLVQKADHASLAGLVEEHHNSHTAEEARLQSHCDDGFAKSAKDLACVNEAVLAELAKENTALADHTTSRFEEVKSVIQKKDGDINARVDELTSMTNTTFAGVDGRMEEMLRAFRARVGLVEKELLEKTGGIRADCRSDIERLRGDYEQESARLDADLGDLHVKHDVTKQEIAFIQSKLADQREWAQKQMTETATATRSVQVDLQEGMAASMKMLHALRDDAITFREKIAKHVSVLQQSTDRQGGAISTIEAKRGRLQSDLDALAGDHKAYTTDMDSWADDFRIKVERLFKSMEPSKANWRIFRAAQRTQDLPKPMGLKSPTFSIRALRQVQMEFFPSGTNNSLEGQAVLRVFFPCGSHVKYQVWVGLETEGPRESGPNGSLTADFFISDWQKSLLLMAPCLYRWRSLRI